MKQYINEYKRLQKLAGIISEMKVRNPASKFDIGDIVYDKNWNAYDETPTALHIIDKVLNSDLIPRTDSLNGLDPTYYEPDIPWYKTDDEQWFPQSDLINSIDEYKINNPGSDFNLEDAFNRSPQYHSYNNVLELIKSYDDEDILFDFKDVFPENGIISKEDYISFTLDYIDDLSEAGMDKANWVSISDPDVFRKAKLI
jgi:hypothetical protein